MSKKIAFLVLSDGCCWLSVCIIGFISYAGYELPDSIYIVAVCILLPINSALNPLIYSRFGYALLKKLYKWIRSPTRANNA